jgi:hypothetical protein
MGFTVDGFNRAKSQMAAEFNKAITEADMRRQDAVRVSSDGCAMAPANAPEKPTDTGAGADASPAAVDRPGMQADKAI